MHEGVHGENHRYQVGSFMNWSRRDWLFLLAVTLLAGALRFYQLGTVPPGFQFDEAFNAMDAGQVLNGNRPLFLPANAGREVIYTYWQALLAALFGLNVRTLRLASAIAGFLTVPVTYLLLRALLRRYSRRTALFASLTLAISLWHVHFSHYGIRVILTPLFFSAAFGLFWLGVHGYHKRTRLVAYGLSGLFTGLSVWTHPTGRLAPFVLIGFVLWLLWRDPRQRKWRVDGALSGLIITGLVAFLVFLPLGLEFYHQPALFTGHASEVSIFAERVSGDTPAVAVAENILRVLGMFAIEGDREWTHNLAGRPVFDPLLSIAFLIGLFIWARRIARGRPGTPVPDVDADALFLLALWAFVMLFPSVLSEAAPNYSRTLPSMPALFVACGLGLTWFSTIARPRPWVGTAVAALILVVSTVQMTYDYFVRFPRLSEVYYLYDADKLEALNYLRPFTEDRQVYLSQLWGDKHATVSLLRWDMGIKSFDSSDTIVLPPPGQGAIYAFPSEQIERAEQVAALWPDATVETITDPFDQILLMNVLVDADTALKLPLPYTTIVSATASFSEAPTLQGMQADDPDKQVTLLWRAEQPMWRDLTSFLHLIDRDGRRVGQIDKLPGNGSYPTTSWTPGERVLDRYHPTILDHCAGQEPLRVQVGWYEIADDHTARPRSDGPGTSALAGHLTLPIDSHPDGFLRPPIALQTALSPTLTLQGYNLIASDMQAGSPFVLDLYWRSDHPQDQPSPAELTSALQITDGTYRSQLWIDELAPHARWDSGEVICRRIRARLPDDIAPGPYELVLATPDGSPNPLAPLPVAALQVGQTTRLFTPPDLLIATNAHLGESGEGDEIELLGIADLRLASPQLSATPALSVTMVWQAVTPPQGNYKAFLHLTDQSGSIIAQSDKIPGAANTTNGWLAGEVIPDTHILALPAEIGSGPYRLVAGLYDPISNVRLIARDARDSPLAGDAIPFDELYLQDILNSAAP